MNKVIINAEDRKGSVMPEVKDIVVTDIGSVYIKTSDGYTNLTDGHHVLNEKFVGKIDRIIRGSTIEITEYGYIG